MTSIFTYSPLLEYDHIRLLLLQPAASLDDDLVGSLQHISLTDHYHDLIEPYTALSYVWGEPKPVDNILLGGREFGITANLGKALRDLRDADRTHRIWADALCIDQGNIPERNQQVALMGQIYSRANNTVIYLGTLTPGAEVLVREIDRGTALRAPGSSVADEPPSDKEAILHAADEGVLAQPWFRRVWVFQELVLSRKPWAQFGARRIRWQDLCRLLVPLLAARRESRGRKAGLTILESMDDARTRYWRGHHSPLSGDAAAEGPGGLGDHDDRDDDDGGRGGDPCRLWRLLDMRKDCGVTDPRDFVFAHMGIISDREEALKYIRIDYTQTASEVFLATGRYMHRCAGLQPLFGAMGPPRPIDSGLPSWVPDWGRRICEGGAASGRRPKSGPSPAPPATSGGAAEAFPIYEAVRILRVSGVLPPPSLPLADFRRRIERYCRELAQKERRENPWQDFVGMLAAAGTDDNDDDDDDDEGAPGNLWPNKLIHLGMGLPLRIFGGRPYPALEEYLFSEQWWSSPREARLALLATGTVIVVPRGARRGDVAASLLWSPAVAHGLFTPRSPDLALEVAIVRCHDAASTTATTPLPSMAAGAATVFERDYVSRYVSAMSARDNDSNDDDNNDDNGNDNDNVVCRRSGIDEILFLHGTLVGVCRDDANKTVGMVPGAASLLSPWYMWFHDEGLALVGGWSDAHDVAGMLGRRRATTNDPFAGRSHVLVLH
ncbi:putative HET domain-containing protein [Rosellinia necatrix]|uniref:Putative HET domain-containing protein n=1 Tax=Rosellinia necatrix TaxID=77044 RepID=A0A1S8A6M9_ROSNE|nr:putative HET domain-containing protein [Rosellinia necatrix]